MPPPKKRQLRRKLSESSSSDHDNNDDPELSSTTTTTTKHGIEDNTHNHKKLNLKEALELRKMKRKRPGIDAHQLLKVQISSDHSSKDGNKLYTSNNAVEKEDPWKLQTGGMVNMEQLKKKKMTGNIFESESNVMNTEILMHKFIEQEMKKKIVASQEDEEGIALQEESHQQQERSISSSAQNIETKTFLEKLKEDLFVNSAQKKDEKMKEDVRYLSTTADMLIAVPEVDLGIDAKIKNIERTEKIRDKIGSKKEEKKEQPGDGLLSTRFDLRFERRMNRMQNATDDLVYDRFKKRAIARRR